MELFLYQDQFDQLVQGIYEKIRKHDEQLGRKSAEFDLGKLEGTVTCLMCPRKCIAYRMARLNVYGTSMWIIHALPTHEEIEQANAQGLPSWGGVWPVYPGGGN